MRRRRSSISPRRVVDYVACPFCECWSLGLQANGKIVRHTYGLGSVPKRPLSCRRDICPASGKTREEGHRLWLEATT
jgi:hypothetical protein